MEVSWLAKSTHIRVLLQQQDCRSILSLHQLRALTASQRQCVRFHQYKMLIPTPLNLGVTLNQMFIRVIGCYCAVFYETMYHDHIPFKSACSKSMSSPMNTLPFGHCARHYLQYIRRARVWHFQSSERSNLSLIKTSICLCLQYSMPYG